MLRRLVKWHSSIGEIAWALILTTMMINYNTYSRVAWRNDRIALRYVTCPDGVVVEELAASKHEVPRPNFITQGVSLHRDVVWLIGFEQLTRVT